MAESLTTTAACLIGTTRSSSESLGLNWTLKTGLGNLRRCSHSPVTTSHTLTLLSVEAETSLDPFLHQDRLESVNWLRQIGLKVLSPAEGVYMG